MADNEKEKMTLRQYGYSVRKVIKRAFTISPLSAIVKLADSIIMAALPIATTFFAALTTTALTEAYGGVEGASQSALLYVAITAALGIAALVWNSISQYISMKTSYLIRAAIEDELTYQFGNLPFHMYDDKDTIDLHDKALQFSRSFSYIFTTVGSMASSILGAIGSIAALIFVSPWLSLAILLAAIPGVWIQIKLARDQMKHWDSNITSRRRRWLMHNALHTPRAVADLRVYGSTKRLLKTYSKLRDQDEGDRIKIELKSTGNQLMADTIEAVVQLGSLIWITLQIISQAQPVGQFLYVQQLVSRAFSQLGALASQLGQMDEDLAHLVDYQTFMEIETYESTGKALTSAPERIEFKDVNFTYPKTQKLVLTNISLHMDRGERIAIVGENGAGKSTLIKLLMGLYEPTSGHILVDGEDLRKIDLASWHKQISLLMQEFSIYEFSTIKDNITLSNTSDSDATEKLNQAMKEAEFTDVAKGLKYGIDTYVSRRISRGGNSETSTELSGGQQQRLALARNLYRDSPIIVLDEPTSAIDALAESKIFKRLFQKRNKTIVMVSHRLTTIEKADRIYVIEHGKIVQSGTHKELVKAKGAYYTMFESQLREGDNK